MPEASRSRFPAVTRLAGPLVGAMLLSTCAGDKTEYLSIAVTPVEIAFDGSAAQLEITGQTKDDDQPLEGWAVVKTDCGTVNGANAKDGVQVWVAEGSGIARYRCDFALDSCCEGVMTLTATLGKLSAEARVLVSEEIVDPNDPVTPIVSSSGGGGGSFAADDVQLFGTLMEGSGAYALARLNDPTHPSVGFPGYTDHLKLRSDGRVIYIDEGGTENVLRIFVPDRFDYDPNSIEWRWRYPSTPAKNDLRIPTPACDGTYVGVTSFYTYPGTGKVIYKCYMSDDWYDTSGNVVLDEGYVMAIGTNGDLFVSRWSNGTQFWLVESDGDAIPVTGLEYYSSVIHVRTNRRGGFWALVRETNDVYAVWEIKSTGEATRDGTFGAAPTATTGAVPTILDRDGNAYSFGYASDEVFVDLVVKFPREPASSSIVYTEENATPNDWSTTPPKVYTKIHISYLVTGP